MTAATQRWLAPATAVLGLDLAVVVLLGPLVSGVIDYRVSTLLNHQLVGSDAVTLGVIVPLTLAAAALVQRRSPAGPLLALPAALAAWYFAAELVLGPDRTGLPGNDEAFLPLFLGVLLLSAAVTLGAWHAVAGGSPRLGRRASGWVAGLLLVVVILFVIGRYLPAWLDIVRNTPSPDYAAGPGMWWTIAFEDLALLLPAAAATAVGLLRRAPWAGTAACAVSGLPGPDRRRRHGDGLVDDAARRRGRHRRHGSHHERDRAGHRSPRGAVLDRRPADTAAGDGRTGSRDPSRPRGSQHLLSAYEEDG